MTKQESKDLTIEVWEEIGNRKLVIKSELNLKTWVKIKDLKYKCPLCELFNNTNNRFLPWKLNCVGCPLKEAGKQCYSKSKSNPYAIWSDGLSSINNRVKAAREIVKITKAWKVK